MADRNATDAEKLRLLAHWFDLHDEIKGTPGREVQTDLRRIADRLEKLDGKPLPPMPRDDIRPGVHRFNKVICALCDNGYKECIGICDD